MDDIGNHVDIYNKVCYGCGADFRFAHDKRFMRNRGTNFWLCRSCVMWIIYHDTTINRNRRNQRKPKFKEKRQQRVGTFHNGKWHSAKLVDAVRIGVCNMCRKVVPFDISKTNMGHWKYDTTDYGLNTIELCISCHRKMDMEFQIGNNHRDSKTGKFV